MSATGLMPDEKPDRKPDRRSWKRLEHLRTLQEQGTQAVVDAIKQEDKPRAP